MGFTINFFYRPSPYPYINIMREKEFKHQLKHCRGYLYEITILEEKGFGLYKVSVPFDKVLALIRDVPQIFHIWDIMISHTQEVFYTSKHHTNARNFLAPKDLELKEVYWYCCKTDLYEHMHY